MRLENNIFYVYLHINRDTLSPFYVGKGHGRRAYHKGSRSTYWKSYTQKNEYDVIILESDLDEKTSYDKEIYWINRIGRLDKGLGTLLNQTDGGKYNKGRNNKGENNPRYGISLSEDIKYNISKSLKGKYLGENAARYGKTFTDETKKKMSDSHKGYKASYETKKRMSDSQTGENNGRFKHKSNDLPCFVTISRSKKKPYMVRIKGRYIGVYYTVEEAVNKIKEIEDIK